ncbi:MAG: metal-dependent transcriptional regulator [Firmicutes bacterium]|nr:metal-dependent transcriptional regulator [Alicyclobacillaceae bacterium]MCL6496295.1 metal-dependent transcriptional regulator [Bacillota bacterium]
MVSPRASARGPKRSGHGGELGAEAYLEAIYVLSQEEPPERVVAARVAEYLGVSPVSVSRALTRLEKQGDVAARTPTIQLTEQGWRRAASVLRRHHLAERWLEDRLGLSLVEAHLEAERIARALSDRVADALWEELGRPTTCPHGNPIPGVGVHVPAEPLAVVPPGVYVVDRIYEQLENVEAVLIWVEEAGLLPGSRVRVRGGPAGGTREIATLGPDGEEKAVYQVEPQIGRRILVRLPDPPDRSE